MNSLINCTDTGISRDTKCLDFMNRCMNKKQCIPPPVRTSAAAGTSYYDVLLLRYGVDFYTVPVLLLLMLAVLCVPCTSSYNFRNWYDE